MAKPLLTRTVDDLLLRSDGDGRTIYGTVVPYNTPTEVDDGRGRYREMFAPGAFARSIRERGHKVTLAVQHDLRTRFPIGKATRLEERSEGLWGEFYVPDTTDGNDAIQLVKSEIVTAFSVSFRPVHDHRDDNGVVVRTEAGLAHVGLVSEPAYPDAQVAGIRSAPPDLTSEAALRRLALFERTL